MNDEEIGRLTREGIPPRGAQYWDKIHAALGEIDNEQSTSGDFSSNNMDTEENVTRLSTMTTQPNKYDSGSTGRVRILAAVAAVVVVLAVGAALVPQLRQDSTSEIASRSSDVAVTDGSPEAAGSPDGDNGQATPIGEASDAAVSDTTIPENEEPDDVISDLTVPVNQAEPDLKFDFGDLDSYQEIDGIEWIWFDRWTFGDRSGVALESEPRYELATDFHGGSNVNPMLRSYPLAPDVSVLELDPDGFEAACSDTSLGAEFIDSDVSSLLNLEGQVSLTFNEENEVTVIRDQRGC